MIKLGTNDKDDKGHNQQQIKIEIPHIWSQFYPVQSISAE